MPRINQLQDQYAHEDFLREIRKGQGITGLMHTRALSDASGIPYQTLLRRLQRPEEFTLGEIKKLLKSIPVSPLALLAFVGIRRKDLQKYQDGAKTNAG